MNNQKPQLIQLFTKSNFDSKKKINRSPDQTFAFSPNYQEEGITSEDLLAIEAQGVKIFRYFTQITIHGKTRQFTDGVYVRGYQSILENKNGSTGVKYHAIDAAKKKYIQDLCLFAGWRTQRNSSDEYIYFGRIVRTGADREQVHAECKEAYDKVDVSKGYVTKGMYHQPSSLIGPECFIVKVHIGAILQKDVEPFLSSFINLEAAKAAKATKEAERAAELAQREANRFNYTQQCKEAKQVAAETIAALDLPMCEIRNKQGHQGYYIEASFKDGKPAYRVTFVHPKEGRKTIAQTGIFMEVPDRSQLASFNSWGRERPVTSPREIHKLYSL